MTTGSWWVPREQVAAVADRIRLIHDEGAGQEGALGRADDGRHLGLRAKLPQ